MPLIVRAVLHAVCDSALGFGLGLGLVAVVPPDHAGAVLAAMRGHPAGRDSAIVGEVLTEPAGHVILNTLLGGERVVDMLVGEQLPRIC